MDNNNVSVVLDEVHYTQRRDDCSSCPNDFRISAMLTSFLIFQECVMTLIVTSLTRLCYQEIALRRMEFTYAAGSA